MIIVTYIWVWVRNYPPPPPPPRLIQGPLGQLWILLQACLYLLTIYTYSDNCQLSGNSSVVLSNRALQTLTCTWSKMGRREQCEWERKRAAANCCSMEQFLPQRTKQKVGTATSQQQEQLHGTSELKLAVATVQSFTDGEPPSPNIVQQQLIITTANTQPTCIATWHWSTRHCWFSAERWTQLK